MCVSGEEGEGEGEGGYLGEGTDQREEEEEEEEVDEGRWEEGWWRTDTVDCWILAACVRLVFHRHRRAGNDSDTHIFLYLRQLQK